MHPEFTCPLAKVDEERQKKAGGLLNSSEGSIHCIKALGLFMGSWSAISVPLSLLTMPMIVPLIIAVGVCAVGLGLLVTAVMLKRIANKRSVELATLDQDLNAVKAFKKSEPHISRYQERLAAVNERINNFAKSKEQIKLRELPKLKEKASIKRQKKSAESPALSTLSVFAASSPVSTPSSQTNLLEKNSLLARREKIANAAELRAKKAAEEKAREKLNNPQTFAAKCDEVERGESQQPLLRSRRPSSG